MSFCQFAERIRAACCKKKEKFIKPIPKKITNDFYWNRSVTSLYALCDKYGIYNMIAATPQAIEDMQEESILMYGEPHYETELYKNRDHAVKILDFAMNACDIDEENATRFDRLVKARLMRDSLNEYIEELEK